MHAQQVHGRPLRRLFRDQAAGALYFAHVPRHRPAAGVSSFTSLRTSPHQPDRARSLRPPDGVCAPCSQSRVLRPAANRSNGLPMNRWNIPVELEREVLARDRACVYCGIGFALLPATRGARPSGEHIVNDAQIVTRQNIARCCVSCNASKGTKELRRWLASSYCRRKGISESTVARVVQEGLSTLGASPGLGYPK